MCHNQGDWKSEKKKQETVVFVYGKASAYNVGNSGSIPGEGNGNPLQHSCLENPMDGGAW